MENFSRYIELMEKYSSLQTNGSASDIELVLEEINEVWPLLTIDEKRSANNYVIRGDKRSCLGNTKKLLE